MSDSRGDKKAWNKPPSGFKKERRQRERSRVNQAIREASHTDDGPDTLVRKRCDAYDWT